MSMAPIRGTRSRQSTIAIGIMLLMLSVEASAQAWSWTSEKVGRGSTSSIALDPGQNLHLAYLTREAKVYYAFRPAGSVKWLSIKVVDSTHSNVHIYPRVAADKSGRPHLCVGTSVLLYIALQNQQWVTQEIDPGSGTISYHCSIAVGPDGTPHWAGITNFCPAGSSTAISGMPIWKTVYG